MVTILGPPGAESGMCSWRTSRSARHRRIWGLLGLVPRSRLPRRMTRDPLQRCGDYVSGLRSSPWWSPHDVPEAAALESRSDAIAEEFGDLVLAGRLRLHPESQGGPRPSLSDGDWNMFELWTHGRPHLGNLVEAPVTAQVLNAMRGAITMPRGNVFFSVLQPGVHVRAHCGPTNTRIRLHLGIQVPPGAGMRVGTEARTWQEGKCLVFDDSWEHEAENPSERSRSVLLVDIWHPDLTVQQREALGEGQADTNQIGQPRGWLRQDRELPIGASGRPTPIDCAIFGALDTVRNARLIGSARRVRALELPFVTTAARRLLWVLAGEGEDEASGDWEAAAAIADDAIWFELAELATGLDHRLHASELIDLVQICGVSWRTWPGRTEAMTEFLDAWPPGEKAALADDLTKLGTLKLMLRALAEKTRCTGRPPFGALVPLVCAAHRRSVTEHLRSAPVRGTLEQ